MPTAAMDETTVKELLDLLEKFGWETGVDELKRRIEEGCETRQCLTYRYFVGWMAGERGLDADSDQQLTFLETEPDWRPWANVGRAFIALRRYRYDAVQELLVQAQTASTEEDRLLRATIQHCRGALLVHQDYYNAARTELCAALSVFGPHHFATGRVLDTLGMAYGAKDNFYAAREFYELAVQFKERFRDQAGLAVTNGQLGRLYLSWGLSDLAGKHFLADWNICQNIGDRLGEVRMCNDLGRVANRRRQWREAADWLDTGLGLCDANWTITRAYLLQDRARAHLGQGEIAAAAAQVEEALNLFAAHNNGKGFPEGSAYAHYVNGQVLRAQGHFAEADRVLRRAKSYLFL
jgi:tetratricopeptide (TPR) repeat protein